MDPAIGQDNPRKVSLSDVLSGNPERIFFLHAEATRENLELEYKQLLLRFHPDELQLMHSEELETFSGSFRRTYCKVHQLTNFSSAPKYFIDKAYEHWVQYFANKQNLIHPNGFIVKVDVIIKGIPKSLIDLVDEYEYEKDKVITISILGNSSVIKLLSMPKVGEKYTKYITLYCIDQLIQLINESIYIFEAPGLFSYGVIEPNFKCDYLPSVITIQLTKNGYELDTVE